jgi:tripartite-type tricarboxylate transporter receptor subunit TctC
MGLRNASNAMVAAGMGILFALPAAADPISDFYKGKRLKYIQSSAPGGGYDATGRTVARHLPRHIPGKPSIIFQNMPGAGGIKAGNFLYNVAPQDGSVIGGVQRTVPQAQIMRHKGVKFDVSKFQWLGSVTNESGVLIAMANAPVKKLADIFTTSSFMGSVGPTDTEFYPALLNNVMGAKFKIVSGYKGNPDIFLAMRRGEVHGVNGSWSSVKVGVGNDIKAGKIRVIVQMSLARHPALDKLGAPMIIDYIDRKHVLPQYTVEEAKTFWRLMLTSKAMGRPQLVGPGVPKDRVKALRAAYMATMKDPAFVKDMERQGREVTPLSGEQVQKMIADIAAAPRATIDKLDDVIRYKGKRTVVKIKLAKHTGKVTATKKGGRRIVIMYKGKNVTAKVSGARTKITIGGKKAKRKAVKVGMNCTFTYPAPGREATNIDCKR